MDCQHVRWSMRMKHIAAVIVVTAVLLFTQTYTSARGAEYKIPQTVDMKPVAEEPAELYALSAVLMDGESGRVLYEKDGERPPGKCQHNQGAYLYCGARELSGG